MEYYHFRIDYFDKNINSYQTEYHYDASADFIERYAVSFLNQSDFKFNGQRIDGTAVNAIKIYRSSARYYDCLNQYIAKHTFPPTSEFLTYTDYFTEITAECIARFGNVVKNDDMEKNEQNQNTPIVFISHAEMDKNFVEPLVTLLEGMGLDKSNLFCSSIPGYWIPKGNIYDFLRDKFTNHKIFVLFVQSPRFYKRPVCLNEMGAAWALKTEYFSLLTKDMTYDKMNGVVNDRDICIKVDDSNATDRLIDLRNEILQFLNLQRVDEHKWNRLSRNLLNAVNAIDYSQEEDNQKKNIIPDFKDVLLPYFDKIIDLLDLPNFNNWAGYFANEGGSEMSDSKYNSLIKLKDELMKCQEIDGYHDFWSLSQNMRELLQDLFKVYYTHCELRPDKVWWFYKYYQLPRYNFKNKYVSEYNEYEYLLGDLMYELARLANLLLTKIRKYDPSYKSADGVFTFVGTDVSFVMYRDEEISDKPYPGLKEFVSARLSRSFHLGKTTNIIETLQKEKIIN